MRPGAARTGGRSYGAQQLNGRRLSVRDYKRPRRAGLAGDGSWLRPFAAGLALGLSVAVVVFLAGHRVHGAALPTAAAPMPAAAAPVTHHGQHGSRGPHAAAAASARPAVQGLAAGGAAPAAAPAATVGAAGSAGGQSAADGSTASAAAAGAGLVTRYDFYQMLPRSQVLVPGRESADAHAVDGAPVQRPGSYFLQIGSYRDATEAERVRQQVQKLGLSASVQRIVVDAATWHRVRVGPIYDLSELNRLRHELAAGKLGALVVRVEP